MGVLERAVAAPHVFAHAIEMAHEGVALNIIQRQLGHTGLGTTSIDLKASTTPRSSMPSTHGEHQ